QTGRNRRAEGPGAFRTHPPAAPRRRAGIAPSRGRAARMNVRTLPALAGWRWIMRGFALLRRQPIALLAITFLNLLLLSLSVLVPLVGSIAPLVLAPALMVGLMRAVRTADEGRMPLPSMLFAAFREDGGRAWRPLLLLGGFNAIATMLALGLAALFDGGAMMQLATGSIDDGDPVVVHEGSLWLAAAAFVAAYAPVQMAMWYSPLFVAWHRTPVAKSLFFSLLAVWRNRRAFVVYALGWFSIAFAGSLVVRTVQDAFATHPFVMSMILSPLSLALITVIYCSFWPTYREPVNDAAVAPFGDVAHGAQPCTQHPGPSRRRPRAARPITPATSFPRARSEPARAHRCRCLPGQRSRPPQSARAPRSARYGTRCRDRRRTPPARRR